MFLAKRLFNKMCSLCSTNVNTNIHCSPKSTKSPVFGLLYNTPFYSLCKISIVYKCIRGARCLKTTYFFTKKEEGKVEEEEEEDEEGKVVPTSIIFNCLLFMRIQTGLTVRCKS